jgi:hypothetical protein
MQPERAHERADPALQQHRLTEIISWHGSTIQPTSSTAQLVDRILAAHCFPARRRTPALVLSGVAAEHAVQLRA